MVSRVLEPQPLFVADHPEAESRSATRLAIHFRPHGATRLGGGPKRTTLQKTRFEQMFLGKGNWQKRNLTYIARRKRNFLK